MARHVLAPNARSGFEWRPGENLRRWVDHGFDREILIERSIVVVVVAAGRRTRVVFHSRMTRTLLGDILMAVEAIVLR